MKRRAARTSRPIRRQLEPTFLKSSLEGAAHAKDLAQPQDGELKASLPPARLYLSTFTHFLCRFAASAMTLR